MTGRECTLRTHVNAVATAVFCAVSLLGVQAQTAPAPAAEQVPAAATNPGETTLVSNTLHLRVGQSMFVNTTDRLRRVYVSNPDILDSVTSNPHQIVVTAKAPGLSSLVLWDESGQSQAYQVISNLDLEPLRTAMKNALPYENIQIEGNLDEIALSGTVSNPAAAEQANKLAAQFSKNVVSSLIVGLQHPPQVRLKVRVVEIDRSRAQQLGFDFFTAGKNTVNASTGQFPAITVGQSQTQTGNNANANVSSLLGLQSLLNLFYYNSQQGAGVAIQDLINKQVLQILAEPTISTVSGQKASFLSGGEFPFPVVQGGTGGFTSVTIQFRPFGVSLDFTPNVMPDGTIQMKVSPEVSSLDFTNAVTVSGFTVPALITHRADTQVELKSGQSFAISGLLDNRTTDSLEKIPGIADIPILGKLFQTKSSSHSVSELAVIVTPTLVDPLSETPHPTQPAQPVPFLNPQKFDKTFVPKAGQGAR